MAAVVQIATQCSEIVHPPTMNLCLRFGKNPRISLGSEECKIFKALFMFQVTRSNVALWSDHDFAQLEHGRTIYAKFELLPVYVVFCFSQNDIL